VLLKCRIIRSK